MSELTIQIVGWNSGDDLPEALAMLKQLPPGEVVIRYIDNASLDNSVQLVRRELPGADVIELNENTGFGGGHNEGLARCETSYVMLHNPDLRMDWEGVKKLLAAFEDKSLGAVQGLLYRDPIKRIIDSAGVVETLAFNGRERGSGEIDAGQYNEAADLWAVTGAAGIYRMAALRDVAHSSHEILDEDFMAYKEDVDLGWRLGKAGWKARYLPVVQGVHRREVGRTGVWGWGINPRVVMGRLKSRRTYYSLRNWIWMIVKNATWKQLLWRELFVDGRALIWLGLSLMYPPLFLVWTDMWRGLPRMMQKRINTEP